MLILPLGERKNAFKLDSHSRLKVCLHWKATYHIVKACIFSFIWNNEKSTESYWFLFKEKEDRRTGYI